MDEELTEISNDSESEDESEKVDPLDGVEEYKSGSEVTGSESDQKSTLSSTFTNNIVMSVVKKLKNPFGIPEFGIDTIAYHRECSDTSQKESTEPKRRYKYETKEQQEIRLLRQRMLQMKNRLWAGLMVPEKAEEERKRSTEVRRQRRAQARQMETPEEAAERKRKHAERMRMSRKRLLALETPEQTAARIAKRNQRQKLRDQQRQAKETPEERAARRERKRIYMANLNKKHKTGNYLAASTGKLRLAKEPEVGNTTATTSETVVKSEQTENDWTSIS